MVKSFYECTPHTHTHPPPPVRVLGALLENRARALLENRATTSSSKCSCAEMRLRSRSRKLCSSVSAVRSRFHASRSRPDVSTSSVRSVAKADTPGGGVCGGGAEVEGRL